MAKIFYIYLLLICAVFPLLVTGCGSESSESKSVATTYTDAVKSDKNWTYTFGNIKGDGFGVSISDAYCLAWSFKYEESFKASEYVSFYIQKPNESKETIEGTYISVCEDALGIYKLGFVDLGLKTETVLASVTKSDVQKDTLEDISTSTKTDSSTATPTPTPTTSPTVTPSPQPAKPAITFVLVPGLYSSDTTPQFIVSSDIDLESLTCKLDDIAVSCSLSTPKLSDFINLSVLNGNHKFEVTGNGLAGGVSDKISYSFTVDTVGPTITFNSAPTTKVANSNGSASVVVGFGGLSLGDVLLYKINNGNWTSSTNINSIVVTQGTGTHTIYLKGRDSLNNEGSAVSASWTVNARFYLTTVSGSTVIKNRSDCCVSSYWFTTIFAADTWGNASTGCNNLSYAGYTDWTLASSSILTSLSGDGIANFISNMNYALWTSTNGGLGKYTVNLQSGVTGSAATGSNRNAICTRVGPQ